jgi:hypothetical protein
MAHVVLILAAAYSALGVLFAVVFLARGMNKVDHATAGAPVRFFVLVFPGVAALWPLMLRKWLRARRSA